MIFPQELLLNVAPVRLSIPKRHETFIVPVFVTVLPEFTTIANVLTAVEEKLMMPLLIKVDAVSRIIPVTVNWLISRVPVLLIVSRPPV